MIEDRRNSNRQPRPFWEARMFCLRASRGRSGVHAIRQTELRLLANGNQLADRAFIIIGLVRLPDER